MKKCLKSFGQTNSTKRKEAFGYWNQCHDMCALPFTNGSHSPIVLSSPSKIAEATFKRGFSTPKVTLNCLVVWTPRVSP